MKTKRSRLVKSFTLQKVCILACCCVWFLELPVSLYVSFLIVVVVVVVVVVRLRSLQLFCSK